MRLLSLAFVAMLMAACTVSPGHVGVSSTWGSVAEETLDSGPYFNAIAVVDEIPTSQQTFEDAVDTESVDSAIAVMGDTMQTLGYSANVSWSINGGPAARHLYVENGLREGRISEFQDAVLRPLLREAVKQVFPTYELRALVSSTEGAATQIQERLSVMVNQRLGVTEGEPLVVVINDVSLSNLDYDNALEEAFRRTIQARQEQELAQQTLERDRINMQRQISEAEAARRARVEGATGEAEALRLTADAQRYQREQEAAANASFYDALRDAGVDPNVYLYTQSWNGTVPYINAGGGDSGSVQTLIVPPMPNLNMLGR